MGLMIIPIRIHLTSQVQLVPRPCVWRKMLFSQWCVCVSIVFLLGGCASCSLCVWCFCWESVLVVLCVWCFCWESVFVVLCVCVWCFCWESVLVVLCVCVCGVSAKRVFLLFCVCVSSSCH